jgi:cell wall-associated NlpC family hydrolase
MSWAADYIGIPWVPGESDCWHFARRVWREQFGWEVPVIDVDATSRLLSSRAFAGHAERAKWQSVSAPCNGDAVLMGRNATPSHVGIWVDGAILHSLEHSGVVYTQPNALTQIGMRVLGYYRRAA